MLCHRADVRVGDGMISSQDDRHGSRGAHLAHDPPDGLVALGLVGRGDLGVAVIHHGQYLERIHAEIHVRAGRGTVVVAEADGSGTEPGSGPVAHGLVHGGPDDGHVHSRQVFGVQDQGKLGERRAGAGVRRFSPTTDGHARHQGVQGGSSNERSEAAADPLARGAVRRRRSAPEETKRRIIAGTGTGGFSSVAREEHNPYLRQPWRPPDLGPGAG
jgi:hypothetical protein